MADFPTMVAEVEARAAEANRTERGADHKEIVRQVAAENGVDFDDLRNACLDAWVQGVSG